jgi:hypothetical protein
LFEKNKGSELFENLFFVIKIKMYGTVDALSGTITFLKDAVIGDL